MDEKSVDNWEEFISLSSIDDELPNLVSVFTRPRAGVKHIYICSSFGKDWFGFFVWWHIKLHGLFHTNAQNHKKAQRELTSAYLKEQMECIQNQINKIRNSNSMADSKWSE